MFLRGENIVCGTTTTGTGTLTLAACPAGIGGLDPVAASIFGTSGAWPCNPIIVEYTDSTFKTVSQMEVGQNCTMTLGATIGSVTLTRNPALSVSAGAENNSTPSAITIGTAANVLIYFGPTSLDLIQPMQGYAVSGITNNDGFGFAPFQGTSTGATPVNFTNGLAMFQRCLLHSSGLIKSVSLRLQTSVSTPTTSTLDAGLFEFTSAGLPGKKIITFATLSSSLGSTGVKTLTAASAVFIPAGYYVLGLLPAWTGGTGSPTLIAGIASAPSPFGGNLGQQGQLQIISQSGGDLNDPPTLTSPSGYITNTSEFRVFFRST